MFDTYIIFDISLQYAFLTRSLFTYSVLREPEGSIKFQNLIVRSAEHVANFVIFDNSSSDRFSIPGVSPSFPPSIDD